VFEEPSMSTKSTEIPLGTDALLDRLESSGVLVPSPADVKDYLTRYPELAGMVERGAAAAGDRFGDAAQLSLEVYHDREADDEFLCLYVRQREYDRTIMATIEELWSEFDVELAQSRGWLQISTDFQSPR
jgi:hypothetical protein